MRRYSKNKLILLWDLGGAMRLNKFLTILLGMLMTLTHLAFAADTQTKENIVKKQDVKEFIQNMVTKHNFKQEELEELFAEVDIKDDIIKSISHPAEGIPWYRYRRIFLSDRRANAGVKFWNEHAETLAKAEKEYGVPASTIVAILGVETCYGKFQGKYRVIDSLSTLSFAYPPRAKFFKKELEQYLLMARENNFDPRRFHGSYAGAIGAPQFMPSSYRTYAVDYTGDKTKDLEHNPDDTIGSVANYLKKNGWQRNQPITAPAIVKGEKYQKVQSKKLRKPKYTVAELAKYGIKPSKNADNKQKAFLIQLEKPESKEYWLGYQNFYAITRYNPSVKYAMAVYQLSDAIEKAKAKQDAKTVA